MTTLTTSLEGTIGSTLTPANSGFDSISIGTNAGAVFSTPAAHGSSAARFTTGTTATTSYGAWTTSLGSGVSVWYVRFNLYVEAAVPTNHRLMQWGNSNGSCMDIELRTDNSIRVRNASAGAAIFGNVSLATWYRIEMMITFSQTAGQARLLVFNGKDSVTSTLDTTTAADNYFGVGLPTYARFGIIGNTANETGLLIDDIAVGTDGLFGPVVPPNKLPVVTLPASISTFFKQPVTVPILSASDPDNSGPLTYSWSLVEKPTGSTLTTTSTDPSSFTFTPDAVGTFVVQCAINDGMDTTTARTAVEVNTPKYLLTNGLPSPTRLVIL